MTANPAEASLEYPRHSGSFLDRAIHRADDAVETHHVAVLLLLLLATAAAVSLASREKPLWLDEYFSLHTELLRSPGAIWDYQIKSPISLDPPLYHWLSYYALRAVGNSVFGARIVSLIAYLVFIACIFTLLRRLANTRTALFAASLALSTALFDFAFEARPYSLMTAAGAGALLLWYWSWTGRRRTLALIGLAACIGTAMLSHYFGCLIAIPIGIGELVRCWSRRKVAVGVFAALLAGGCSAAIYVPLIAAAKEFQAHYRVGVTWEPVLDTYTLLLWNCGQTLALVVIGVCTMMLLRARLPETSGRRISLEPAVAASFTCFAVLPLFGYFLAKIGSASLLPRYTLPSGIGFVLLAAMGLALAAQERPGLLLAATLMALISPATRGVTQVHHAIMHWDYIGKIPPGVHLSRLVGFRQPVSVFTKEPDLPIVTAQLDYGLQFSDQMPEPIRRRAVFLTSSDSGEDRAIGEAHAVAVAMSKNPTVRIDIQDYRAFFRSHPRFLIFSSTWVNSRVLQNHGDVRLEGTYGGIEIYSASVPAPTPVPE